MKNISKKEKKKTRGRELVSEVIWLLWQVSEIRVAGWLGSLAEGK